MGLHSRQKRDLFFAWLPAAIGVLVICAESTDYFSAEHTRLMLEQLCRWLHCFGHPDLMTDNHILRKTGHFTGYGMLSLLFYRAWRLTGLILSIRRPRMVDVIFSFACTLLVASGDEYHQSFLPSRTSRPQDVLLDVTGAAIFLLFFQIWRWFHRRRQRQPVPVG